MKLNKKRIQIIKKCKVKLQKLKSDYEETLSRPSTKAKKSPDFIEIAQFEIDQQKSKFFRDRMKQLLPEINFALKKIDYGTYGQCEVTGEEIQASRLLALPWTRKSIDAFNKLQHI